MTDPQGTDESPPVATEPPPTAEDELTRRGARVERAAAVSFLLAMAAAIGLTVVYWEGGQPQAEGILLAVVLGGIGVGIVLWAKHFMPAEEVAEDRHPMESSEEDIAAFAADFQAGGSSLQRRRVLVATAGGACAALGVALLFPIRSLGPRPGRGLKQTAYKGGNIRVVDENGTPVDPRDLPVDGFITVWPDGHTDDADPDAAQDDGQQDALGLGLPALPVDDGEADGGARRHEEADCRSALGPGAAPRDLVVSGRRRPGGHWREVVGAAGIGHGSLPRVRRIGLRVPIHATRPNSATIPTSQATKPSGMGPVRPIGRPPGSSGSSRYRT